MNAFCFMIMSWKAQWMRRNMKKKFYSRFEEGKTFKQMNGVKVVHFHNIFLNIFRKVSQFYFYLKILLLYLGLVVSYVNHNMQREERERTIATYDPCSHQASILKYFSNKAKKAILNQFINCKKVNLDRKCRAPFHGHINVVYFDQQMHA